jgi:murein L,D-transpeptidase YafK
MSNISKKLMIRATLFIMLLLALFQICCVEAREEAIFLNDTKQLIISGFLTRHSIDRVIVIDKIAMKLYHYENEELSPGYPVPIALGFDPVNDKERRGDGRTPEGEYFIYAKHPSESFSYFLEISYPSYDDLERGLKDDLISQAEARRIESGLINLDGGIRGTMLGDAIGIHTSRNRIDGHSVTSRNWTLGCIALEYDDMEALYRKTRIGDKVLIIGESYVRSYIEDLDEDLNSD